MWFGQLAHSGQGKAYLWEERASDRYSQMEGGPDDYGDGGSPQRDADRH